MKESCLRELIARWVKDATPPTCENGADDAKIGNAKAEGFRQGMKKCATDLHQLVNILGDSPSCEGQPK